MDQVALLPSNKRLRVVIALSTDRTEALLDSLVPLKPFKVVQTRPMVDMAARQDGLILELQVLEADGAGLVHG